MSQIRSSLSVLHEFHGELRQRNRNRNGNPQGADLQLEYGLTSREAEVAMLISEGLSNTTIAGALHISTHTARHHTRRVLAKLGVHSRAAAGAVIRG